MNTLQNYVDLYNNGLISLGELQNAVALENMASDTRTYVLEQRLGGPVTVRVY